MKGQKHLRHDVTDLPGPGWKECRTCKRDIRFAIEDEIAFDEAREKLFETSIDSRRIPKDHRGRGCRVERYPPIEIGVLHCEGHKTFFTERRLSPSERLLDRIRDELGFDIPKNARIVRTFAGRVQKSAGAWSWTIQVYDANDRFERSLDIGGYEPCSAIVRVKKLVAYDSPTTQSISIGGV